MNSKIFIGAAYYPEMWAENEVEKDIERCRTLGVNTLRIGEFAWGRMEPEEGKYDFGWLERTVDRLHEAGINTIMCTPTATPPRWFLEKYPEVIKVNNSGRRDAIASRCHICKTSPLMREKNRGIVTALAKHFGRRPGVIGWQIDNELYPYDWGCRCGLCVKAFRKYLAEKYHTVDELNAKWGMTRWSLDYPSFDSVEPPAPDEWYHPSLYTEWIRFQCRQIISYVNEQADIIHSLSDAPVGTDMMPHNILGYYDVNEKLDVIQYNHYDPAAKLYTNTFAYDFLRPIKSRPFWVTETQVGWNGSVFAECGYRPEGNCYANTMLPIALGGEMNLYWLFRTHPNGHEMGHGALFTTSGRSHRVSEEVGRTAADLEKCADFMSGTRIESKIAIHYSTDAMSNFAAAPLIKGFEYRTALIENFHRAFRHFNTDIIDAPHSLEGYDVVISPFMTTIKDDLKERLIAWINNGGTWIAGPMSDIMTDYTSKYTEAPFSFLEELAGVYTKYQKPIGNDVFRAHFADGTDVGISTCYDAFVPAEGTVSLAEYEGEFGGCSAITERRVGRGRVILLGTVPSKEALLRLVGMKPIAEASDSICLVSRTGEENGIIAVNLENTAGSVTLEGNYIELISGRVLSGNVSVMPYEVLVLKKTD